MRASPAQSAKGYQTHVGLVRRLRVMRLARTGCGLSGHCNPYRVGNARQG